MNICKVCDGSGFNALTAEDCVVCQGYGVVCDECEHAHTEIQAVRCSCECGASWTVYLPTCTVCDKIISEPVCLNPACSQKRR